MNHCKICFKIIKIDDFCRFFDSEIHICPACQKALEPKFTHFKVEEYKAMAFYEYTELIKKLIFTYKGCFDYEMKDVFLDLFIKEIKAQYKGYIIIPIPSYVKDDELRGFNHVVEVCKQIGININPVIEKTSHFKQAENTAKQRQQIGKHLQLKATDKLHNKRVLIVDDIYTTGSTMKAAIKLVEQLQPKEIRILVLAKTKDKSSTKSNTKHSLH